MKYLAIVLLIFSLNAQDPAKPSTDQTKPAADASTSSTDSTQTPQEPAKPAQDASKPADQPAATAAPTPAPAAAPGEGWIQGSFEVGYRWIPNISGNTDAYRSTVNLGEGPKLLDADFTLLNPTKKIFDRADVHATSWGGDPYNTLRVDVSKDGWYRLTADYRNIAYFNFLPTYADPSLTLGTVLDQNSFDTAIRTTRIQLDILPKKWITPYIGFERNTQFGRGITVFHTDQDEFPVASIFSDQTNTYRAGVRMELGRFHITLEQGGTTFKDDQGASDNIPNPGNFPGPFLGQTMQLSQLDELYRVRGDSIYSKALLAANPFPWMSITGNFIYSKPRTDINYSENSAGNFYLNHILQFYSAGQDILTGDANAPHTSANVTVELRPFRKLRIVERLMTDRYHNASNALLAENLLVSGMPLTDQQLANDRLVLNYNEEEIDFFYDLTSHITLRGGYRYMWGDADVRAPLLTGQSLEPGNLKRSVGIAGITYRLGKKFRVIGDAEGSDSDQIFFRTSLQQYEKMHIRASYDLLTSLRFNADFSLLNNSNPDPTIKLDFASKVESASLNWTPKGGKWANLLLDYSRSAVRSDILYLIPNTLTPAPSIYQENGHSLSAIASVKWISFGGTLYVSSGSRPTQYYQPLARLSVPINKHVQWNTEWRWYSLAEVFYTSEGFRSNQITTSLRFQR